MRLKAEEANCPLETDLSGRELIQFFLKTPRGAFPKRCNRSDRKRAIEDIDAYLLSFYSPELFESAGACDGASMRTVA